MKIAIVNLAAAAGEATEHAVELPIDPIWYGIIAFAILMTLAVVTLSWKGISYRH